MSAVSPRGRLALAVSPLVAAAFLVAGALLVAAPVRAASCNSPSHQISLSSGSVTPGSGTTATSFTFSVTYRSNAGCAPASVEVVVAGVGTYSMSGSGTNYTSGVTFRYTRTLPTGSRAYSFRAVAGSKAGYDTATLTSVSPAAVTVVSPTATPVPATPVPATPRPTSPPPPPPPPTVAPSATPAPTPTATPASTVSAAESPTASPLAATTTPFTPTPVPSLDGVVGPISSDGGTEAAGGAATGGKPARPDRATIFGRIAAETPSLLVWLIATAGGLCLFLVLSRPARQLETAPSAGSVALPEQAPTPMVNAALTLAETGGEGRLPRWLRPSVQAARHAEPGREPRRGDG